MGKWAVIAAVDVGHSSVRMLAGRCDRSGRLEGVAYGRTAARGITRGVITDLSESAQCIAKVREGVEHQLGRMISRVFVSLSGGRIFAVRGEGSTPVLGDGFEVDEVDIQRALIAAEVAAVPPSREALHVLPMAYSVDGQSGVRNPRGMFGHELGVIAEIVSADMVHTQNVLRAVRRAGLHTDGLVFGSLAAARVALTDAQREEGTVYIDMGAGSTGVVAFRGGNPVSAFTLPIGGMHFDGDLAYGLKVGLPEAERIKTIGPAEASPGICEALTHIIRARAEEIFEFILDGLGDFRASGAVLAGGMSGLSGMTALAAEVLGMPCEIVTVPETGAPLGPADMAALGAIMLYSRGAGNAAARTSPMSWLHKAFMNMSRGAVTPTSRRDKHAGN